MMYDVFQNDEILYVLLSEKWYTFDPETNVLTRETTLDLFYMPSDEMLKIEPNSNIKLQIENSIIKLVLNI